MKKNIFLLYGLTNLFLASYGQDTIVTGYETSILAKVSEVTKHNVLYKPFNDQDGLTKSIMNIDVWTIKYENGKIDTLNKNVVYLDEAFLKVSRENPEVLLKPENRVFITSNNEEASRALELLTNELRQWGYWHVIYNDFEAHFIIELVMEKSSAFDKSVYTIFKTRENIEFKRSKKYKMTATSYNVYNATKAVINELVEKYFFQEFK